MNRQDQCKPSVPAKLLNKMETQPQFLAALRAQCMKRRKLIRKRGLRVLLAGL
jgi:hypothetical protein